jgi:hypothetical protein
MAFLSFDEVGEVPGVWCESDEDRNLFKILLIVFLRGLLVLGEEVTAVAVADIGDFSEVVVEVVVMLVGLDSTVDKGEGSKEVVMFRVCISFLSESTEFVVFSGVVVVVMVEEEDEEEGNNLEKRLESGIFSK